jgi:hypothetical protein
LADFKTQNAFLFLAHAMFRHDCPLAAKPASTPRRLVYKKTWRDSVPIDMLLSAASVLVVAQRSSEIPEGLTNYPVLITRKSGKDFMLTRYYTMFLKRVIIKGFFC